MKVLLILFSAIAVVHSFPYFRAVMDALQAFGILKEIIPLSYSKMEDRNRFRIFKSNYENMPDIATIKKGELVINPFAHMTPEEVKSILGSKYKKPTFEHRGTTYIIDQKEARKLQKKQRKHKKCHL